MPSLTELTFKSHSFIHYYFFYCIFLDCIIPKSLQESTAHLLTSLHILLRNITASNEETTSSYTSSPIALCCCWNNKFEYFSERYTCTLHMCHILYMLTVIFISMYACNYMHNDSSFCPVNNSTTACTNVLHLFHHRAQKL